VDHETLGTLEAGSVRSQESGGSYFQFWREVLPQPNFDEIRHPHGLPVWTSLFFAMISQQRKSLSTSQD